MESQTVGRNGRKVVKVDALGGIFSPIPGQPVRVAYSAGHPDSKDKILMFQCPKSAIPVEVFELLGLWNECRLLGVLPRAGGLLDQPQIVRRAFAIFASEWATVDRDRAATTAGMAAASALQAAFGARK